METTKTNTRQVLKTDRDILKNAEYLSPFNLKFYNHAENNPEFLLRESFKDMDLQLEYRRIQPWPTFIERGKLNELIRISHILFNITCEVPDRFFNRDIDRIANYFCFPRTFVEKQMKDYDTEYCKDYFCRTDFLFSDKHTKCIELNVSTNIGGLQIPVWEEKCLKNKFIAEFCKLNAIEFKGSYTTHHMLDHIIRVMSKKGLLSNYLNMVIIDGLNEIDFFDYLKEIFHKITKKNKLKGSLHKCNVQDLNILQDKVFYKEKQINFVMEVMVGVIPVSLIELKNNGNIYLLNGTATSLLSNKFNLAILSENVESEKLSNEEKDIIKKYIPWTRKCFPYQTVYNNKKIDLLPFILKNKDQMVLKPAGGHAGIGIYIGGETDHDTWVKVVNKAAKNRDCVVQEYFQAGQLVYQSNPKGFQTMNTVYGIVTFGNNYGGCLLRVNSTEKSKVINGYQGAELSIVIPT